MPLKDPALVVLISEGQEGRLKSLKASCTFSSVHPHAIHGAVIDRKEDGHLALLGRPARCLITDPHPVDALGGDGPVVSLSSGALSDAGRGQKIVSLHESQDSSPGGADPLESPSHPDVPVALTVKGRFAENGVDLFDHLPIGERANRSPRPGHRLRPAPLKVQSRSRDLPHSTDSGQAVTFPVGGRDGLAHFLGLLRDKGRFCSSLLIFSRRSSDSMVAFPSFSRSRLISSLSGPFLFFRAACPAERNSSRHREIRGAVVPHSLESSSRSSPRSNLRTIWLFNLAENLWGFRAVLSPANPAVTSDGPLLPALPSSIVDTSCVVSFTPYPVSKETVDQTTLRIPLR